MNISGKNLSSVQCLQIVQEEKRCTFSVEQRLLQKKPHNCEKLGKNLTARILQIFQNFGYHRFFPNISDFFFLILTRCIFRILDEEEVDSLVEEGGEGLFSISFTSSLHTDTIRNINNNITTHESSFFVKGRLKEKFFFNSCASKEGEGKGPDITLRRQKFQRP